MLALDEAVLLVELLDVADVRGGGERDVVARPRLEGLEGLALLRVAETVEQYDASGLVRRIAEAADSLEDRLSRGLDLY